MVISLILKSTKSCQIFKNVMPHLLGNAPGQPYRYKVQQIRQNGRYQIADRHNNDTPHHHRHIHKAALGVDGIDGLTGQLRSIEAQHAGGQGQGNGQHQ